MYIKTVERAHSPKNLWEKILLSRNYAKALVQIDEHLQYFPKAIIHRNKQRLTKIHQYLIRMRKIKLKELNGRKARMVGIHRKVEQREERRERKALVAAKLEQSIEKELVGRLAKGTYGDIYNFPEVPYQKALENLEDEEEEESESESESEMEDEDERMIEYVEDLEDEDEEDLEDMEYRGAGQWGSDDDSEDDSEEGDDEDENDNDDDEEKPVAKEDKKRRKRKDGKPAAGAKSRRKGTRVEIEYEEEREDDREEQQTEMATASAW